MGRHIFKFSSMTIVMLVMFGLLVTAPGALAQMHGGGMGAQNGNTNQQQPGMNSNMPQNGAMGTQNNAETSFIGNVKRNMKAETDLSKLAMKNSSNDSVKKLAQQVITENHSNEMELTSATASENSSNAPMFGEQIPSQTRQAEKKMKKLTGTQFDAMYLSQLSGYVKDDQQIASDAPTMSNSADMGSLTMKLRTTADERAQQITQIAQSENFKIQ